ncbi:HLA class II histocompatibility antigen gamma chain isoform X2 [Tachyglossus aculeatus]|uniref:HLA class II histocompatibility antigen gamma chain isoform X2 n=1 Tax=Tachyglossus aculeatus TaxID=9261 RepID=UPI0018F4D92F|nr:HLA class II histocompatibility antigen gamma chain isoform X2 [Tachyglossus aculeatus]
MEDQQRLISNPERVPIMGVNSRSPRSCGSGTVYTVFSLLATLLIAGQAVTVYFVYQQQQNINKLTLTSQNLQLESLQRKLPKPHVPFSKLRVAQPLLMREAAPENLPSNANLALSNSTKDQVMHLLLKGGFPKMYPELNESFQDNMEQLKSNMGHESWQNFKHWMHHWLLFELSKKPQDAVPTETPKHVTPKKVLTKCQQQASLVPPVHPGQFRPKCDENGNYLPLQCQGSTGYCWCVYSNGTMITGTESRTRNNCSDLLETMSSGLGLDPIQDI